MSAYRNQLSDGARPAYAEAIASAARVYAAACRDRDLLAIVSGPRAAAEAAWYPGHPLGTVDAIADAIKNLLERQTAPRAAA